jgi:Na+(H+)/acetate symporter ActP
MIVRTNSLEENTMFIKAAFGLAVILATASGALAATRSQSVAPSHDVYTVYTPNGAYVGTDPDLSVRFELNRDWARGR